MRDKNQQGASAVEFALILPLLLTLMLGVIEFGFFFNQQLSITQAAREGARDYAIHHSDPGYSQAELEAIVAKAAPALGEVTTKVSSTNNCSGSSKTAIVTVSRSYTTLTGWFEFLTDTELNGEGAMRCGG
ncbi:TadE/TadG family type IV pilus assembly protein [Paeniglutamicibacter kerguelensis]|uniref:Flp pilus assembly protein TadG n=1 Tax=Paeniglutamicibacter kerguelensis TaxID=254788 RepID=A0ABS4X8P7_9MICC|nr:TadE/TadG family type IV pilus assembly protein [Paeniglutamicibacter kerguelensis]MBP2384847.1 Flp pilus assembly protein TadG [Paeniglutamicibacter kerguelensis]